MTHPYAIAHSLHAANGTLHRLEGFFGSYRWLSNFHEVPIQAAGSSRIYGSTEAAYQAAKCADPTQRDLFTTASPRDAKLLGRAVALRPDWDAAKVRVMLAANRIKYTDPALRKLLLATGDAKLVEGNWWHDNYWGSCGPLFGCRRCKGTGRNMLGRVLMQIRQEVREVGGEGARMDAPRTLLTSP